MNLYFRFILVLLRALIASRLPPLEAVRLRFRVWPLDCDINLHLTNSRYLAFMDLGRTALLTRSGILRVSLKHKWASVAQAIEITFIREIGPFQAFDVVSRLVCWDEKYWYIEQNFEVNGVLMATAMIRGVFLKGGRKVPCRQVLQALGFDGPSPVFPPTIEAWSTLSMIKKSSGTVVGASD